METPKKSIVPVPNCALAVCGPAQRKKKANIMVSAFKHL
jgi:hypothetical protein